MTPMVTSPGSDRPPLYLHVGLMKTGTTYIQRTLRGASAEVAEQGLNLIPDNQPMGYKLARAIRLNPEGAPNPQARRLLDHVTTRLAEQPDTPALLTVETLASSSPQVIERLVAACPTHRVEVVITARDLARSLPSAWQQSIRSGRTWTFEEYLEGVMSTEGAAARHFWVSHGLVNVAKRWTTAAPPERVHIVTVPPPGGDRDLLLQRFFPLVGLDPVTLPRPQARSNESLGAAQVEMLRRLNAILPDDLFYRERHGNLVKRYFALQVLAPMSSERYLMPARHRAWCDEQAAQTIEGLREGGYHVIGDLEDLRPVDASFTDGDQGGTEADISAAAIGAVRQLLADYASGRLDEIKVPPVPQEGQLIPARNTPGGDPHADGYDED